MSPQVLNSYNYAGLNPISKSDPTGLYAERIIHGTIEALSYALYGQSYVDNLTISAEESAQELANDIANFQVESGLTGASIAAPFVGLTTGYGAAISAGSIVLYGLDKWCEHRECRKWGPGTSDPALTVQQIIVGDTVNLNLNRDLGGAKSEQQRSSPPAKSSDPQTQDSKSIRQSLSEQLRSIQAQIRAIQAQLNALQKKSQPIK